MLPSGQWKGLVNHCVGKWQPIGVKVKIVEPGGVATDFGGRSMDMQHNLELTEYNDFVNGFMTAMQAAMDPSNMSKPELIADIIYTAATDGKDTLRYRAGADAEQLLSARSSMTDEEFFCYDESEFSDTLK